MNYISTRQAFGLLGIWICFQSHHIVQTQKIQILPEAEKNHAGQVIEVGSTLTLTCVKELGDEDDGDEEGSGSTLKLSPITKLDDNEDEIFWTNDGIHDWEVIQRFHSCYLIS
jgi:hypothetical protein